MGRVEVIDERRQRRERAASGTRRRRYRARSRRAPRSSRRCSRSAPRAAKIGLEGIEPVGVLQVGVPGDHGAQRRRVVSGDQQRQAGDRLVADVRGSGPARCSRGSRAAGRCRSLAGRDRPASRWRLGGLHRGPQIWFEARVARCERAVPSESRVGSRQRAQHGEDRTAIAATRCAPQTRPLTSRI